MEKIIHTVNRRRIRANVHIRELATSVVLNYKEFIQPLFVDENITKRTTIASLNDINSDTIVSVIQQIESDIFNGITKFLLFPVPIVKSNKNFDFSFVLKVVETIKARFGNSIWLATDICLCAYTLHGHCGILHHSENKIDNDASVKVLANYALQLANAGADCIAPSDMMDGRIFAIRQILDINNFDEVAIMSYSSKFSSQFYGPFREACKSSPNNANTLKDRKTYQASPFNTNDAILSSIRDADEGADILMVKPALPYADVIKELSSLVQVPIAAYHVSGEYQSIELLAQHNLIQRDKAHVEVWTTLKRSGANIIISYAARNAKQWIENIEY